MPYELMKIRLLNGTHSALSYMSYLLDHRDVDRAMADSGVVFENCYCNGPMCVPSRASLFSGRLVSNVGAFDNGCEFPAQIPTFVHHLRAAGYETSLAGKAHFIGPDQLYGFARRLNAEIYPSP